MLALDFKSNVKFTKCWKANNLHYFVAKTIWNAFILQQKLGLYDLMSCVLFIVWASQLLEHRRKEFMLFSTEWQVTMALKSIINCKLMCHISLFFMQPSFLITMLCLKIPREQPQPQKYLRSSMLNHWMVSKRSIG